MNKFLKQETSKWTPNEAANPQLAPALNLSQHVRHSARNRCQRTRRHVVPVKWELACHVTSRFVLVVARRATRTAAGRSAKAPIDFLPDFIMASVRRLFRPTSCPGANWPSGQHEMSAADICASSCSKSRAATRTTTPESAKNFERLESDAACGFLLLVGTPENCRGRQNAPKHALGKHWVGLFCLFC